MQVTAAEGRSETWNEFTEVPPDLDQARTQTGSKPRTETRSRTRLRREDRPQPEATVRLTNTSVGSGLTLDSGLDLHQLSSPERAPPAGAAGNWHSSPMTKERHHHHHHRHDTDTDHSEEEDSVTLRCSTEAGPAGGAHRQDKKKRLRSETEKLQRTLRRHRRVLGVCEEVWCVEQTLMKRRAELREAQRLLQTAHSSTAQARRDAEEWERRAKDSAACLQRTQLQCRELQTEVEALGKSRQLQTQDHRDLTQSPDLDPAWSRGLDSRTQLDSLRDQEQLQQRIQELRSQETTAKSTLQSLVQQQEALLSQRSSLVSAAAEEEQRLEGLRAELDSAQTELRQVLEEVLSERQGLVHLKTLRSKDLDELQETQDRLDQTRTDLDQTRTDLDQTRTDLDQTQTDLDQTRTDLDQTRTDLDQTKDQLDLTRDRLEGTKDRAEQFQAELSQAEDKLCQTRAELLLKLEEVRRKEEELTEKQKELDQSQAAVDRERAELTALGQEVETHRKEAESCFKETERQRNELQEVKEEVERRSEQSSSLQQQCRHLEDRRRHAHRCLSAVEAELEKLKQEQSQSLLTQQEVTKEAAANQEKLNESSELLCFLGEKLEERKVQLQTLQQELSALGEEHKQKQTELRELEKDTENSEGSAAVTESEDRWRCVTQEQLNKLSEELWEREEELLRREAGLRLKEEGLRHKEEELRQKEELSRSRAESKGKEEEPPQEEEGLPSELEDSDGASSEEFYLSTAGLRSASSPEEERWRVELETDKLKLQEDSMKARLRGRLRGRDQSFQELGLEQSVRGLHDSVERLDSLLLRTKTQK